MCGACGSGGGTPSWEDRLERPSRRALVARAAVSNRLLGRGLLVRSWHSGYLLSNGRGRSAHAANLDDLWRTCGHWGFTLPLAVGRPGGLPPGDCGRVEEVALGADIADDRGLVAVWAAALAHTARLPGPLRLLLVDRVEDRALQVDVRRAAVTVEAYPPAPVVPVLSGWGARRAAEHLSAAAGSALQVSVPNAREIRPAAWVSAGTARSPKSRSTRASGPETDTAIGVGASGTSTA